MSTQVAKQLRVHVRIASQFLDMDYLERLTPRELKWLRVFVKEFYSCTRAPHLSKTRKREIINEENSRRRDVWNVFTRVDGKEAK